MRIAGSSRFAGAATLANTRGLPAVSPSLLSGSSPSLLDVGRRAQRNNGIGLSSNARRINQQIQGSATTIFAFSGSNVQTAQQQILALRSQASEGRLSRFVTEDLSAATSNTGSAVDIEA